MKGVIFTGFVDFVGGRLGGDVLARLLESETRWSAAGSYDGGELLALVDRLAAESHRSRADVLRAFGEHLFGYFASLYPVFLEGVESALELMAGIDGYVHGEVKKLYPDADFPHFECAAPAPGRLELQYRSTRPLADLAEGLIRGCVAHFGDRIDVRRTDVGDAGAHAARFSLVPAEG